MGKGFGIVGVIGFAAVALCVVGVAIAGAGGATIVPGVSLAGVSLGDSQAAVRDTLGAPPVRRSGSFASGSVRWEYAARNNLIITFDRGKVSEVTLSAVKGDQIIDRTATGFGLLTPAATIAKAHRRNCGFESGLLPLCRWTTSKGDMTFLVTGDYGDGPNAPIQSIRLERL